METFIFALYMFVLIAIVALTWRWFSANRALALAGAALLVLFTLFVFVVLYPVVPAGDGAANTTILIWCIVAATVSVRLVRYSVVEATTRPRQLAAFGAAAGLVVLMGCALYLQSLWDEMDDGLASVGIWYAAGLASVVAAVLWVRETRARAAFAGALILLFWVGGFLLFRTVYPVSAISVTAQRAETVQTAVLAYRADTGQYPPTLTALVPRYVALLPQPMLLRAQTWCYEASADWYRFGYLATSGYNTPASVKIVGAEGVDPARTWSCAEEAANYNRSIGIRQ